VIIEGNGVILTRGVSASWPNYSHLLYIYSDTAEVTVRRMHFKDGYSYGQDGGAILNSGILTLESCIFNNNRTTHPYAAGGAIASSNTLTVRGCSFYRNTAEAGQSTTVRDNYEGGAIRFSGTALTIVGNLFCESTAHYYNPVVKVGAGTVNASYNVVDVAFGTGSGQCGWIQGTGDTLVTATTPVISGQSFKLFPWSSAANKLPASLPANYPTTDFYGNPISGGGAAGAVQTAVDYGSGYSWLALSVNNSLAGNILVSPAPNEDSFVSNGSVTITADPAGPYSFGYWLVDGVTETTNPHTLTINAHTRIQSVFVLRVDNFTDGTGSETTPGTLRYALTNVENGDVIWFSGVTPGTSVISLEGVLPAVMKSITIEGNGITLTWGADSGSQLLRSYSGGTMGTSIRRVYFKDSRTDGYGGAISSSGILILESCIFGGNVNDGHYVRPGGGAIYHSYGDMTIRGCTFYENRVSDGGLGGSGGAVYFRDSGTLTLEGNLFYGNTADGGYPIVHIVDTGTVNASYNVVDTDYGTSNTQAGWAQRTGDRTFASLGVTSVVPIDPISCAPVNSGLLYILSAAPTDFPTTDFYGTIRTFPGAPGAVATTVSPSTVSSITYGSVSGGEWTLEGDGRRKSPWMGLKGITKTRVNFIAAANTHITIQLDVSSEAGRDWAFISTLDNADATSSSGYYSGTRISGNTLSILVAIPVPDAGSHFFDIGYEKDTYGSEGSDCAWFKVIQ
jgi:hypothetical protein